MNAFFFPHLIQNTSVMGRQVVSVHSDPEFAPAELAQAEFIQGWAKGVD